MKVDSAWNSNYFESFTEAWLRTGKQLLAGGAQSSPRGKKTYEFLGHQLIFPMRHCVLKSKERRLGFTFMYREAWWILTGRNDLESLEEVCPPMRQFSDDGIHMSGAYGPKVVDQLSHAINSLLADGMSRQSVINIWRESPAPSKDIPCTLSYQFLLRKEALHCVVTMRSSDIWLGLPYDVFAVSMLATYIVLNLREHTGKEIRLGNMYHTAGSRHVYQENVEKLAMCTSMSCWETAMNRSVTDPVRIQELHNHMRYSQAPFYHQLANMLYRASDKHTTHFGFLNHATTLV